MRKLSGLGCLLAALLTAGCSIRGGYEQLGRDIVAEVNARAKAIHEVSDEATAQEAIEELRQGAERLRDLTRQLKDLGTPGTQDRARLQKSKWSMRIAVAKVAREGQALAHKIQQTGFLSEATADALIEAADQFAQEVNEVNATVKAYSKDPPPDKAE
jgi:hypothetical protein